ncbi:MAG: sugar phosphate isomerase/epimerase [Clostridia bacterium]|nr:sugar phosphate isomerase/epimerase [Clostridia bacterium]
MKFGVSSYSFDRHLRETKCGYREIIRLAREIGFAGVEFVDLLNPAWGIEGDEIALARAVRAAAEEYGMAIPAYTVAADFLSCDPEAEVERICRKVDVAKELGAKVFRHDASFRLRDLPGYSFEDGIEEMAPRIRRVTEYAAERGIVTCTENHGCVYQAPERVKRLIEAVGHKNYGWLVDLGNFSVVDHDNLEAVKIAAPYAVHVHAKDFLLLPDPGDGAEIPAGFNRSAGGNLWRGTVLGRGNVDAGACLDELKCAGYDGWVSLEFEGPEEVLPSLAEGYSFLARYLM